MADWLEEHDVDLVVLAGYMHLLTPAFLDRFPERIVNVHPSLLPAFPGAHAVEDQLAAGATESGATVHLVNAGIDTGHVLAQECVPVVPGDTPETLHAQIQAVEHRLLPRVVSELCLARSAQASTTRRAWTSSRGGSRSSAGSSWPPAGRRRISRISGST